jgi:ferritin-like metal-binding protein YciE
MAREPKDMHYLFAETLKDIYFAERHILRALPKMAKSAQSDKLKEAFLTHRDETEGQVERLDKVFELIGKPARGKTCEAILGILEEGKEVMEEFAGNPALDPALLSAAQAVEHYEISRYGTLKNWAKQLGINEAVPLLEATLVEEKNADSLLSKLALAKINFEAA